MDKKLQAHGSFFSVSVVYLETATMDDLLARMADLLSKARYIISSRTTYTKYIESALDEMYVMRNEYDELKARPSPLVKSGEESDQLAVDVLTEFASNLARNQQPLDPDIAKVLRENWGKLFEDDTAAPQSHTKGADGWLPIETAPKDGTWIIGAYFCRDNTHAPLRLHSVDKMRWISKRSLWQNRYCDKDEGYVPTHWMSAAPPSTAGLPANGEEKGNGLELVRCHTPQHAGQQCAGELEAALAVRDGAETRKPGIVTATDRKGNVLSKIDVAQVADDRASKSNENKN